MSRIKEYYFNEINGIDDDAIDALDMAYYCYMQEERLKAEMQEIKKQLEDG